MTMKNNMIKLEQYVNRQGALVYTIYASKKLASLLRKAGYPEIDVFVDMLRIAWRTAVGNNPSDNDTDATREVLAKFAHGKGNGSISNYPISKRLEQEIAGAIEIEHIGIIQ